MNTEMVGPGVVRLPLNWQMDDESKAWMTSMMTTSSLWLLEVMTDPKASSVRIVMLLQGHQEEDLILLSPIVLRKG